MAAEKRRDSRGRILKEGESQRPDGRYCFRFCLQNGERRTVYSWRLTKSDSVPAGKRDNLSLREQEECIRSDLADGITPNGHDLTLNELIAKYLSLKGKLKANTLTTYCTVWDRFVKNSLGSKKICKLTYSCLLDFYKNLLDNGKSLATLRVINNGLIHPALRLATRDRVIRNNPADHILDDLGGTHDTRKGIKRAIPQEELNAFLTYIQKDDLSLYAPLIVTLLGTGCRIGEAAGLQWSDIDFRKSEIHITRQLQYNKTPDNPKYHFFMETPKSDAGTRMIPLLPEVRKAFLNTKRLQMMLGLHCRIQVDGYMDFIFLNRKGMPINPRSVDGWISRTVKSYNDMENQLAQEEHREPLLIRPFSVHSLRHSFATLYCQHEDNLRVIADVLGHSDIATTAEIYAEATSARKQKSFENLRIFDAI